MRDKVAHSYSKNGGMCDRKWRVNITGRVQLSKQTRELNYYGEI
jgi:hypothetical protein